MQLRNQALICTLLAVLVSLQLSVGVLDTKSQTLVAQSGQRLGAEINRETSLKHLVDQKAVHLAGGWETLDSEGNYDIVQSRFNDAVIEGGFSGTSLELFAYLNKQTFEFQLDQAAPLRITVPALRRYDYFMLAEKLKVGQHQFRLRLVDRAGGPLLVHSLRTDGDFLPGNFPARTKIVGFGSSTMDFCGITWQLGEAKGWEVINRGIGGTTVIGEGQFRVARDVLPWQPEEMLINYGSNDWFAGLPVEDFQTAYTSMLRQLNDGLPQTHFVVIGLFARKNGNEDTRPQYNAAIRKAIIDSGLAERTRYVEIKNYNYQTDTIDGTHPNPNVVANKFVPQLLPLF
jgi:lysophospholipase L1-like esterase